MINELLKGITYNNINDKISIITYEELEKYIDSLDDVSAIKTMKNLFSYNVSRLVEEKKPIKVAFLVYSSSEWQCEKIYRMLEDDDKFDPVVIVCGYSHGSNETIRNTYVDTCKYFRTSEPKHNVIYAGYSNGPKNQDWLSEFSILVYFITSKNTMIPFNLDMQNQSISKLIIHIPYSFYLVKPVEEKFKKSPIIKMAWKCYTSSDLEKSFLASESLLGDYNMIPVGMPKLDDLIESSVKIRENIWKGEAKYKIIWAPHFNMKQNATFFENYVFFYEFAKKNPEISWIVHPHPRMELGVVEAGIFDNLQDYHNYLNKWDKLPNARVMAAGDYLDVFLSSDALIHDSISFLIEYFFTNKPQLRLLPEKPRELNTVGEMIKDEVYSARGNDYSEIEDFINKVVVQGRDSKQNDRVQFIDEHFRNDYFGRSSELIVRDIKKDLEKKMKKVIVFGVFDYFHLGHLRLFKQALNYGNYLIVAVQKEEYIKVFKPEANILYSEDERVEIIQSISLVDEVVLFESVKDDIKKFDFDIFAVGEDQTSDWIKEAIEWCINNGKEVVHLKRTPGLSSRDIKNEIK